MHTCSFPRNVFQSAYSQERQAMSECKTIQKLGLFLPQVPVVMLPI